MLDFTKLWDRRYLFGPNPFDFSRSDHIFFWLAVVLLILAAAAKIFSINIEAGSPKRYLLGRVFNFAITIGILSLLWAGARHENIPWLSRHIVVLAVFLIGFLWVGFIAKYFFGNFGFQQKTWQDEQLKHKYLSKK